MSRRIPLFPLPEIVLLPGTLLPLHIFEPRYRAMVADALEADRTIGMTMLKSGADAHEDAPAIHRIGTAGEIVESEALPDGRYNILLEARFRFRVLEERAPDPYRVALVEEIRTVPFPEAGEGERIVASATGLYGEISRALDLPPLPSEIISPERLASEMALRLRYAPPELQALLEADSLASRFETLQGRMREWKERLDFLAPFRPTQLDPRNN
jgi:Lon protease-like protein